MNYSETAKNEIARLSCSTDCCKRAFMSALIRAGGSLLLGRDGIKMLLTFSDAKISEKAEKTMQEIASGITIARDGNETLLSGENMVKVLYALGIFYRKSSGETAVRSGIQPSIIRDDCCAVSYVRGLFLGAGSVTLSGGYHLEFNLSHESLAQDLKKLLQRFNVPCHTHKRAEHYLVYIKDNEAVSDCLALMGATSAVIELNNEYTMRQFSQQINRRNNCDIANIQKTVNASVRIVESVRYIDATIGLASIDEKLQEVAKARIERPDDSFSVLADALGLSKSTLKNRFKKLDEIAEELREKETKEK